MYIRKVKKSESKSQPMLTIVLLLPGLCISVKLKNLKANHNDERYKKFKEVVVYIRKVKKSESKSQQTLPTPAKVVWLCISVKLKNLKANHNTFLERINLLLVVYIRKVKKSESKSQRVRFFC